MKNKFVFVVALYNVENWIRKTIRSVLLQEYDNYRCSSVDNLSTDKSAQIIKKMIDNNEKFTFIENTEKKYSLRNIYEAIHNHTHDDEIVVILDGDDFLFEKGVLNRLNDIYNEKKCLLTYGSYINLSDKMKGKFSKKVPNYIVESNNFRNYEWCTSHLRTFKSSLFKKINKEDLCDEEGNFYTMAGDLAIMFPMLEMSSERSVYIDKILHIWNDLNELNEHKQDNRKQIGIEKIIRNGKKYDRID